VCSSAVRPPWPYRQRELCLPRPPAAKVVVYECYVSRNRNPLPTTIRLMTTPAALPVSAEAVPLDEAVTTLLRRALWTQTLNRLPGHEASDLRLGLPLGGTSLGEGDAPLAGRRAGVSPASHGSTVPPRPWPAGHSAQGPGPGNSPSGSAWALHSRPISWIPGEDRYDLVPLQPRTLPLPPGAREARFPPPLRPCAWRRRLACWSGRPIIPSESSDHHSPP